MTVKDQRDPLRRFAWGMIAVFACVVGYVLSSGPVLATAFWLAEATGSQKFYAAMWLYYPVLALGPTHPLVLYVEWWVRLFGTVGPG